ncbi:TPA: diacylglycerol kinase family protein [Streptococcus suis]|uniref:YegS/Rv2252/BmrU family lipid kinase n=1 Tax=Streptococcus parasuis TaxID=1501662 RepID=A0ABV2ETI3_9STRE|nr:diacylglycerol kinase family protein [Streptococcus parasuis]NQM54841.1 diacylglycerol kinase family lipid kinase [Streptococcus suis]MDG4478860.1 diacylglycerol kinase family lipid kinase [Streptococcus parasuis]NQN51723.1 diacylglycerol kinase family lipid kinase [Streptococcus suis]NQP57782.1 diacylglycerol kinase family lipid kinase [Streptococcus suis]BCP58843.1 diacylglycerol kinase [Streptococcus parasuis]
MKKALLVVNPSSGGEKAPEFQKLAKEKLENFFDCVVVKETKKAGDATRYAKEAAQEKFDSVFVMGGDGTVNEGISGLANEPYRPTFGFFPLGTVNDLARALGIPLDPATAIAQFDSSRKRPLDIGQVNNSYFMNVAAIGAIPQGINDVSPEEKTRFGKLAYFINGVKELVNNQSYQFEVELNNVSKIITSSTLIIGLTNSIGGFETLLPNAKVDDGLLHLVYLKDSHFLDTVSAIPQLIKGVTEESSSLGYETFTEGKISITDGDLQINIDGDEGDHLPIHVKVLPSHISIYY